MITQYLDRGLYGNPQVKILQKFLNDNGYGKFNASGDFGPQTEIAVKKYQLANKITQTGTVGPITRQALNRDLTNANSVKLYNVAKAFIGSDASPKDLADDEVGCADSVSALLLNAFGNAMGIVYTVSTAYMFRMMRSSPRYIQLEGPQKGAIVISPSGYGNGNLSNGHVGICGEGNVIMSNNSWTGKWEANFTTESWNARYRTLGGFPVYYFKFI